MSRHAMLPMLAVLGTLTTNAGGWAVITVEELPNEIVVGRPVTLTYSVRQHGRSLLSGLNGSIEAQSAGQTIREEASPGMDVGQYNVTLTLPRPGTWTLTVRSGFGKNALTLMPIPAVNAGRTAQTPAAAERGLRLFVAKGCVTCHVHPEVAGSGEVKVGPDLAGRRFTAEYLQRFLVDPNIATTRGPGGFEMPNLKLDPQEIASLVAFITGERAATSGE
ncbi:MAG TPA: cytochrome c [Gemmatimonadales bacterium]|nr:cytochrome c [Gemmatimonadales bacterium]